jgi:hypothetical protein
MGSGRETKWTRASTQTRTSKQPLRRHGNTQAGLRDRPLSGPCFALHAAQCTQVARLWDCETAGPTIRSKRRSQREIQPLSTAHLRVHRSRRPPWTWCLEWQRPRTASHGPQPPGRARSTRCPPTCKQATGGVQENALGDSLPACQNKQPLQREPCSRSPNTSHITI